MSSYIVGPKVVRYACTCGLLKPISELFLCRHCFQLRCTFCLSQEVDSIFCGKCCENLPSSEARLKKNRCGNCQVCPSCHQQLSTRISSKGPSYPGDPKSTPKKMYYLSCLYCRWSSRDVGIPDQSAATGGWPQRENIHADQLQELIDTYKMLVASEKQEKDLQKRKKTTGGVTYIDRTGITATALRKRIRLPVEAPRTLIPPKPKKPQLAVGHESGNGSSSPIGNPRPLISCFRFTSVSLARDRFVVGLVSIVLKPECYPGSVKFKLFGSGGCPPLRAARPAELILKLTNPTQHQTTITFLELDLGMQEIVGNKKSEEEIEANSSSPSSLLSLTSRQPSTIIKPRPINCDIVIPSSKVILLPGDDAAEYDDSGETHNIQDDTKLVVWRKSNKAYVKLLVTPNENLGLGTDVVVGLTMQHVYTNTIAIIVENKEPDKHDHNMRMFLTLGRL